jgi:hypothetical protein
MKKKNNKDIRLKEAFKAWLKRSTNMLVDLYGLGGITIRFHEKKFNEDVKAGTVAFRIKYSSCYKTADIWYLPLVLDLFRKKDFSSLRQALTHEIAHIITTPLGDIAHQRYASEREVEDSIESLTETIAQLCRSLMDAKNIKMV